MWSETLRKKQMIERYHVSPSLLDQFEADCPGDVTKNNPLLKNSPLLYNPQAFEAWWDRRLKTQVQARRMARRVG